MDSQFYWNLIPAEDKFFLDVHASANIGCEDRIRDIIENSENKHILNQQNKSGWTPLMYAACSTNLKTLLLLLDEGVLTDVRNNLGQTALIIASKYGSTDTVSSLIDYKANVNIKDSKGWTAVFYACAFGHRSVVQLLIDKGAIVDLVDNREGFNPLMLSAAAGHEMIVKDLLLCGLNPTIESKLGDTARSLAICNGYLNVKNLIDTYYYSREDQSRVLSKNTIANHTSDAELLTVLQELQLSKYYYIFQKHGIDISTFWKLTDDDLKEIGINLMGPRKKICLAISKHQNKHSKSNSQDNDLLVKLSIENKNLLQQIEKLEADLSSEKESRKVAERSLNAGVDTFKGFAENIQRTVGYALNLGENLKQNQSNLRKLLYCTPDIHSQQFKREIIVPLLEENERLIKQIYHQLLLSSQQTDFRY